MTSNFPPLRPGLTIAIPTYNRPAALARTLDVIIPQVLANENVYLDIYDNCSPEPLPSFSDPRIVGHPRVRLVRNRYNQGFSNFMNCVVNCDTEWAWILGDDDLPAENAVEIILARIAPEYCYMSFKIPSAKTLTNLTEDIIGSGMQKFFDLFEHRFMQMICLSSSIYNIRFVREYIAIGYTNVHCAAPHTLMAMLAIEKGTPWLCSKECIADYQIPDETQHWNRFLVFYGLPSLVPALKLESSRKLARKAIQAALGSKPHKFIPHLREYFGEENGDLAKTFASMRANYSPEFSENRSKAWAWLKVYLHLKYPKVSLFRKKS